MLLYLLTPVNVWLRDRTLYGVVWQDIFVEIDLRLLKAVCKIISFNSLVIKES
jgi:hypothetical protein